jgi:aspartyl-tRNA(Asn)/glutamyl-tRNA(Gln) amidotransferase subunit B
MSGYEAVIGLEVHAQLATKSKIFCGCPTAFGAAPNSQTCPVCSGFPGVLPVMNRRVVDLALHLAIVSGCRIPPLSRMARKNYFYPDLPKAYQVSQFEEPLALGGGVDIAVEGESRRIGLTRIHLEEDAGKLVHAAGPGGKVVSLVDFNRCGVPLIEIVSEPEIRTAEEAMAYLRTLRTMVRWLGICDGNMEEGSLRCDANVSVRPKGTTTLGTKAEIKNMNSVRNVGRAIEHEIARQIEVVTDGGRIVQETRLWDDARGVTVSMRGKEEAHDYRYFPDPDLVPIEISADWIAEVTEALPELPERRRARLAAAHGLPGEQADLLTSDRELADYYEAAVAAGANPREAANWILTGLLGALNRDGKEIKDSPVTAAALAGLLSAIEAGTVSGKMAKEILSEMYTTGKSAPEIIAAKGLTQITDEGAIAAVVDEVIAANVENVEKYKAGQTKVLGHFVGEVMKRTQGKANPALVNKLLKERLD